MLLACPRSAELLPVRKRIIRRAAIIRGLALACAVLSFFAGLVIPFSGCTKGERGESGASGPEQGETSRPKSQRVPEVQRQSFSAKNPWFEDITTAAGIDFKHDSGATGSYFMPESTGSGAALFDFDNDGRLDI